MAAVTWMLQRRERRSSAPGWLWTEFRPFKPTQVPEFNLLITQPSLPVLCELAEPQNAVTSTRTMADYRAAFDSDEFIRFSPLKCRCVAIFPPYFLSTPPPSKPFLSALSQIDM